MFRQYALTALTLFVWSLHGLAQPIFSREQICEDIDDLYLSIKQIHPDMFYETSKRNFDREVRSIKRNLPDSIDLPEVYNRLFPLIGKLNDGHTGLRYKPERLGNKKLYLPLKIFIDKHDYSWRVVEDLSGQENKIPEGAQILSVNSRPAEEISRELVRYMCAEKEFYKIAILNNGLLINYIHYVRYRETDFHVEYTVDGEHFSTRLSPINHQTLKQRSEQAGDQKKENYMLTVKPEASTAILTMNSMSDPQAFKIFADSVFKRIRREKIENLIIDFRYNGGGNAAIGDELLQYISAVPFAQFEKMHTKHSRIAWNARKRNNLREGKIEVTRFQKTALTKNNFRLKGHAYLLISNFTFSSGSFFSWAFQYFNMGTVVGEETGGLAVTFGDFIKHKLPNTQIEYVVSHKIFYGYGTTNRNRHGVIPDYEVPAEDALDFTLDLIRKNPSSRQ